MKDKSPQGGARDQAGECAAAGCPPAGQAGSGLAQLWGLGRAGRAQGVGPPCQAPSAPRCAASRPNEGRRSRRALAKAPLARACLRGRPRPAPVCKQGRPPCQEALRLRQSGRCGLTRRGRRWWCCSWHSPPSRPPPWWGSAQCQSPCRRRAVRGHALRDAQAGGAPTRCGAEVARPWHGQRSWQRADVQLAGWGGGVTEAARLVAAKTAPSPGPLKTGKPSRSRLSRAPGSESKPGSGGGGRRAAGRRAGTHRERPRLSNTTSARSISPQGVNASFSCCQVQSQGRLWTTT